MINKTDKQKERNKRGMFLLPSDIDALRKRVTVKYKKQKIWRELKGRTADTIIIDEGMV